MRETAAKGRALAGALLAAAALLLAGDVEAFRTSSAAALGLEKPRDRAAALKAAGREPRAAPIADDIAGEFFDPLAAIYEPTGFELLQAEDREAFARQPGLEKPRIRAPALETPPALAAAIAEALAVAPPIELELVEAEKLASGLEFWLFKVTSSEISELLEECGRPQAFQGLWTDPVTGLAYARARWYDARNASWLSEDPLQDIDSPNLYAFVAWRPHMATDPMGLRKIDPAKPEWHHLIGETEEIAALLEGTGIDRNDKRFGVLVEAAAHRLTGVGRFFKGVDHLHGAGWNADVAIVIDRLREAGRLTAEELEGGLKRLAASPKYAQFFEYSIEAPMSCGEWRKLRVKARWGVYYESLRARLLERFTQMASANPEVLVRTAEKLAARRAARMKRLGRLMKAGGMGLGIALSIASFAENAEAMGPGWALVSETIDNTPIVGAGRFVTEAVSGEDWIRPEAQYDLIRARLKLLELRTGSEWDYRRFGHSVPTGRGYVGQAGEANYVIPEESFDALFQTLPAVD